MFDKEELLLKLENNEFSTMWEIITDILLKVSGKLYLNPNFSKVFSPYMLCRYISMNESLIEYANILNVINTNSKLSGVQFYQLAYKLIPKQKSGFIKYIKKSKKSSKKLKEDVADNFEITNNLFEI